VSKDIKYPVDLQNVHYFLRVYTRHENEEFDEANQGYNACPNRGNQYHTCSDYCRVKYGAEVDKSDQAASNAASKVKPQAGVPRKQPNGGTHRPDGRYFGTGKNTVTSKR